MPDLAGLVSTKSQGHGTDPRGMHPRAVCVRVRRGVLPSRPLFLQEHLGQSIGAIVLDAMSGLSSALLGSLRLRPGARSGTDRGHTLNQGDQQNKASTTDDVPDTYPGGPAMARTVCGSDRGPGQAPQTPGTAVFGSRLMVSPISCSRFTEEPSSTLSTRPSGMTTTVVGVVTTL